MTLPTQSQPSPAGKTTPGGNTEQPAIKPLDRQPPDIRPLHRAHLVGVCRRGDEPLESLAVAGMYAARDQLLRGWIRAGWSCAQIAQHTRSTTYTIDRLVARLDVQPASTTSKGAA